jgi:hypothetical protein
MDRNYQTEMLAAVNAAIPEDGFITALVARELVEKLRATDPELLEGWLQERAEVIVTDYIHHLVKNRRRPPSPEAKKRENFSQAVEAFMQSGDTQEFRERVSSPFTWHYVVRDDNFKKPVGKMNGADLRYVANSFQATKHQAAFRESFFRAVSKRVGDKCVEEVFTVEQYISMYRSVTGELPPEG